MKLTILLVVLLALYNVEAKKKKGKHHEVASTKKHKVTGPFRMPIFAIRMPIFGAQELVEPSGIQQLNDEAQLPPGTKTVTKTHNSTKGPLKIFTVITESKSTNKSNPKVFRKIIKTIATMKRNGTNGTKSTQSAFNFPEFKMARITFGNPLNLLKTKLGLGDDDDELSDELKEKDCSESSICKSNDEFCDEVYKVCKKKVVPYGACTQKDQCSTAKGSYLCEWGRCVKGQLGDAGTFCDKESECQGKSEELGCFSQNDISRFSKVCVPKLGEGATCGRSAGIFAMFESDDDDNKRCQGDLVCRAVGFFGRKACIKDVSRDQHDYIASIKKSKTKRKHHKH